MSDATPLFVVNPAAQNGAGGRRWPRIASAARALGLEPDRVFTEGPGHATELVRDAIGDGRRRFVAVGGDGTVNEVINGTVGDDGQRLAADVELTLAMIGTGRDTIRTYGIPKHPERAIELLAHGRTRLIDLGRATFTASGDGVASRLFVNVGSCGLTGAVAERANRTTKRFGGTPSFLYATVTTFFGWRNMTFDITIDGEQRTVMANNAICANGRYFGGGIKICPDAEPDDGLFDVLVWGDVNKLDLAINLPRLYRGTHVKHPKARLVRARTVRVEPERPVPIELDGEQPGLTPVTFEIVPGALNLRVPA